MQTSDQEVPKLLYLLEQATLNDERFDSARTMVSFYHFPSKLASTY